jgi:hypothetical protein
MSTPTSKTNSVRYDYPKDWVNWSREFRIKARSLNLWIYIEPDKNIPWPEQPVAPHIANYPKKIVRTETRSSSASRTTATPAPEEVDHETAPKSVGEMTGEGKSNYQLDLSYYSLMTKEFKDYRTNLDKMVDWITSTTSPLIRKTCCKEDMTIDEWYLEFQQTGSAYERDRIADARTKYQAAIKPLSKLPRKFNEWLNEWESAMAEGQDVDLSDTMKARFWAPDLARAVRDALGVWSTTFLETNEDKIKEDKLNYQEVVAKLLRH